MPGCYFHLRNQHRRSEIELARFGCDPIPSASHASRLSDRFEQQGSISLAESLSHTNGVYSFSEVHTFCNGLRFIHRRHLNRDGVVAFGRYFSNDQIEISLPRK